MNSSDEATELAAHVGAAVGRHRAARGLSLGDLARESGLSRTILARIESGTGNPSLDTLWRISRALDVPLGDLLPDERETRIRVIRSREGEPLLADSGMRSWPLHAEGREHRSEMYELDLPKGTDQRTDAHRPLTEEVLVCMSGRARVGPIGEEVELRRGDAVWFVADRPHHYVALADTRLLGWMLYGVAARG